MDKKVIGGQSGPVRPLSQSPAEHGEMERPAAKSINIFSKISRGDSLYNKITTRTTGAGGSFNCLNEKSLFHLNPWDYISNLHFWRGDGAGGWEVLSHLKVLLYVGECP